jgi:hypothetical protein
MSGRSFLFGSPFPATTPRHQRPTSGNPSVPPSNISITASSQASAPNVGGNTSDPIHTYEPAEMFIRAPPGTNLTAFWDWIAFNFDRYYNPLIRTLMTNLFRCYTVTDLTTTVTTFSPGSIIEVLGPEEYDAWREQLVDLHIIFNYTLKYFWNDDLYVINTNATRGTDIATTPTK